MYLFFRGSNLFLGYVDNYMADDMDARKSIFSYMFTFIGGYIMIVKIAKVYIYN